MLALDDLTTDALDKTAHSIAHGVLRLEELTPDYGAERRRLRVMKYRGQAYRGGYHDFIIKTGDRGVPAPGLAGTQDPILPPSCPAHAELDALLGGRLERIECAGVGPAGGKS